VSLAADQLFVIDSDIPVLVLASPRGLVSITEEAGPVKVRGKFVDGTGVETRTFKGKSVVTVEAIAAGRCELLVVPVGAAKGEQVVRRTLDVIVGQGPIPPPVPRPDPKPQPEPKPDPLRVDSVWVVVVEDAAAPRTIETATALNDPYWGGLRPKHDWRHYVSDSPTAIANGYVEQAKRVGYPAVLVLSATDGDPLRVFKLTTVAAIKTAVTEVTK